MSLNSLFDDPELSALVAKVEAAYGPDEIPKAIERTYGAIARDQREQLKAGGVPDTHSLRVMHAAFRRNSRCSLREHSERR